MCGRFANTFDATALTALFQTAIPLSNSRPLPAYNITPGTPVPVILAGDNTRKAGIYALGDSITSSGDQYLWR
jgi:putative SOS response-associated peptidase YedK